MAGFTRLYIYYTNNHRQMVQEKSGHLPKKVARTRDVCRLGNSGDAMKAPVKAGRE
jgi:hypothetical protein